MAIPLIVGLGVAAVGLYKGGKAIMDNMEADDVNDSANSIVQRAEDRLNKSREACQKTLEELGQRKIETLTTTVPHFLEHFNKIKNVDFQHDGDLGNMQLKEFSTQALQSMQESVSFILSSGLGAGIGVGGGVLTAFGAYSGTMAFASAGTGTAISALSGVAAQNATLAWLGGGTLASGGMGVAGGMMALGALTAGPALLVAGWYMGSKAESKLNNAQSNLAEAKKFRSDCRAAVALTDGIANVANTANGILSELRKHSRRNMVKLCNVIDEQGINYAEYNDDAKMIVMKNVKIIQVIKAFLDTPILDEQGNLLGDAESNLMVLHHSIQNNFQGALTA